MPYSFTPLRQLERLYASIVGIVPLLGKINETSERQARQAQGGVAELGAALTATQHALTERIDLNAALLQSVTQGLAEANDPGRSGPRGERQRQLQALQVAMKQVAPENPACHGWSSYSRCDEDGIVRECLRRIKRNIALSRTFIEFGCADGLESTTHQLALDGFIGCWLDADASGIQRIDQALNGLHKPGLLVRHAPATTSESIGSTVKDFKAFLATEDVDFLSFSAAESVPAIASQAIALVRPKLACVAYNAKFPPPTRLEAAPSRDGVTRTDDYFGASLQVWVDRLEGYRLVSCGMNGATAFFVREDVAGAFVEYGVEQLFQPDRSWLVEKNAQPKPTLEWLRQAVLEASVDRPWVIEARVPRMNAFDFEIHRKADQYISGDLARENIWEPFETDVFRRICRTGDFVLDIGGNIGWYSVVASHILGNQGRLITFEPDPDNFTLLARNVARCPNAPATELRHEAVGESLGTAKLFLSATNLGDHRIFDDGTDRAFVEVPLRTLDSLLANETRLPDIVKSDTQGSEARILKGAQGLLSAGWRPVFLMEFWPFGLTGSGDDPLALWDLLVKLDYRMYEVLETNPRLMTLTEQRMKARMATDITAASGGFINILAVPAGSDRLGNLLDLID